MTSTKPIAASDDTTPLPLRNDTILGVCEALGREFGFNPLWLRLAFIAPLFFFPVQMIAAYFVLGGVVALASWAAPDKTASPPPAAAPEAPVGEGEPLRIAA